MKQEIINKLRLKLCEDFDVSQIDFITNTLNIILYDYDVTKQERALTTELGNPDEVVIKKFLASKLVAGCSKRTITYYSQILLQFRNKIQKPLTSIVTDDIRLYLAIRSTQDKISKTSQDNELRVFRSFYKWCESEEIIDKNPTTKLSKIKDRKKVKKAFTEEEIAKLKYQCSLIPKEIERLRNTAIVETLLSTGCRVSELIGIKIDDIDGNELVVLGKGNKERKVYLNASSKLAIDNYLDKRTDNNPYLFVSFSKPYEELQLGAVETILKKLGEKAGVEKTHPHKFRRTAATYAVRKGMPIELVSKMLGHESVATTQIYLEVNDDDVKASHKKYM